MAGTGDEFGGTVALRGGLVSFAGDPFLVAPKAALRYEPDALVWCENGRIRAAGSWSALASGLPPGVPVHEYPGHVLCAGFVDAHVHAVQMDVVGTCGADLLTWLAHTTYPAELAFADPAHASRVAARFVDELLKNGTTTAAVFGSVHPQSVEAVFTEAARVNLRVVAGKVWMDRNAPPELLDTPQSAYDDSRRLIARWHGKGRASYAITPRFAPTSSPEQLRAAGALWKEHPDLFVQTHLAESPREVAWVKELFPDRAHYVDVYDHFGLVGPRAVFAHGIHLGEPELARLHAAGAGIAHCPTSNLFLGSGAFDLFAARRADRPVAVGLGTDIGAGTSFSSLVTLGEAHKVARMHGRTLDAARALWLATAGGAAALGLADRVGNVAPGLDADVVVLDPRATPLLAARAAQAGSIEEILFLLLALGDDRAVRATYAAGTRVHERAPGAGAAS
jgi:guanine deaminase